MSIAIVVVFTKGTAIAEASFLAKKGKAIPYLFTGVLTMINHKPWGISAYNLDFSTKHLF